MPVSEEQRISCSAALSTKSDTPDAMLEAIERSTVGLSGPADLTLVFYSIDHDADAIAEALARHCSDAARIGCCAESIVAGAREVEEGPAIVAWSARLPGVPLSPLHLEYGSEADEGSFVGWTPELLEPWPAGSVLLLLGEPFSFPADRFAHAFNEDHPGVPIVGGMASGANQRGSHRLILQDHVHESGAVGIRLGGNLRVETLVSQGCRPVGQPYVITKADGNLIFELGGKSALVQLQQLFQSLSANEREKMQQGLHVGRVINEYQERFGRGDFLVRNVIGADEASGAIAIGDWVRAGQTVQFHVRDAESADEDLRTMVGKATAATAPTAGALLFTCNGRGSRMFAAPNHDATVVSQAISCDALAGFFAAGEIGPVGGKNFLHGFSASLIVFGK